MNPKPKCPVCNKACRKNQKNKLQCDICKKNVHRKCSKLTVTDLHKRSLSAIPFSCSICMNNITPFSEEESISEPDIQAFDCDARLNSTYLNNQFLPKDNTVDSCYSELPRDRQNWFTITEVHYNRGNLHSKCLKEATNVVHYNRSQL